MESMIKQRQSVIINSFFVPVKFGMIDNVNMVKWFYLLVIKEWTNLTRVTKNAVKIVNCAAIRIVENVFMLNSFCFVCHYWLSKDM